MKPHNLAHLVLVVAMLMSGTSILAQVNVKEGREMDAIGKAGKAEKILKDGFPPGSRHEHAMVPMRDGVRLATDVFIPPGDGPWPVVYTTGYYGRLNSAPQKQTMEGHVVYIVQDARGVYDSEGKDSVQLSSPDQRINDCSDSLDWIAAQKWCNGKIGMWGASGNGVGPFAAALSNNPHLTISLAGASCPWPYYYWGYHNGVRRFLYGWLGHAGIKVPAFPTPTVPSYDLAHWRDILAKAGEQNRAPLIISSGWYDISPEATLDVFTALSAKCTIVANIGPGGHGGYCPFTWPNNRTGREAPPAVASIYDILTGKARAPEKSVLSYFLIGNFRDPASPGNCYKLTHVWPVPNTPTTYYLHSDGSLSTAKPVEADAVQAYVYDPKDPAPSIGIKHMLNSGPFDQRPLKDRKDVLHFISAPLKAPLEITGKIVADLYVTTDVTDTAFIAKFVDIQPDGYEMLVREGPVLARDAEEFLRKPAALEKGRVYHLKIDLRNMAIVIDKGHRLGVLVTSSSNPEYQVHPNSFEPAANVDHAPLAHQMIHLSAKHPSSITLPIISAQK